MTRRRAVRRAFVYTFIITLCIVLTAMAFIIADRRTGTALHGEGYSPSLPGADTAAFTAWFPSRVQVLLRLPAAVREWLQFCIEKAP